jgi:hypothetical protein
MKLKEYAKNIAAIAKKYPNATVVSASDEEGNSFDEVQFTPTAGNFNGRDFDDEGKINAVCIN